MLMGMYLIDKRNYYCIDIHLSFSNLKKLIINNLTQFKLILFSDYFQAPKMYIG